MIIVLISVSLAFLLNQIPFWKQYNTDEKFRLNQNINKLLDIELQYPFLEDSAFRIWWSKNQDSNSDSAQRYKTYCIYLLNFVQDVCDYYNYNAKDINDYIDLPDLVEPAKEFWRSHDPENTNSYSKKFKDLIDKSLK